MFFLKAKRNIINKKQHEACQNTEKSQRANPIQIDRENKLLQFTQIPTTTNTYDRQKWATPKQLNTQTATRQNKGTAETNIASHLKSILFQQWIQPLPKQEQND